MGGGEGLVEIQMDCIDTAFLDVDNPHNGVHIGSVHIHLTPVFMNKINDLTDIVFKNPMSGGVGDHDGGKHIG